MVPVHGSTRPPNISKRSSRISSLMINVIDGMNGTNGRENGYTIRA